MDWLERAVGEGTLPYATADLPGTGGAFKVDPADFVVEEIAERPPSGHGEHLYLWIEKRGLDTEGLRRRLASVLDVEPGDVGMAGNKDAQAVTRQWISVPAAAEARIGSLSGADLAVLEVSRDTEKLRTGRLAGNRFDMVIRGVSPGALERARAIVAALGARGLPAFYGPQRFGRGAETAQMGFALLRGETRGSRGSLRKLAVSAAQSALFNTYLATRIDDGLMHSVIEGDVMIDRRLGTLAWGLDPAATQPRYESRHVVPAGPMFGPRMRAAKRVALARERAVLELAGLSADLAEFERLGRLAPGSRRAIVTWSDDLTVEAAGENALRVRCTLPPGTYATVLLAEVMKIA